MWDNGHEAYFETRVLTADPLQLVNILYQACTQAVREARRHLAEGRIADRSREINKACQVLIELSTALDHERGGELSARLAQLYDYMQRRLIEANMKQQDAPLAEVLGLLSTLSEAWMAVSGSGAPIASAETRPPAQSFQVDTVPDSTWSQGVANGTWASPSIEGSWAARGAESAWALSSDNPWAAPSLFESAHSLQG